MKRTELRLACIKIEAHDILSFEKNFESIHTNVNTAEIPSFTKGTTRLDIGIIQRYYIIQRT